MRADCLALLEGIRLYKRSGLEAKILIESDSEVLVQMICHVFREANYVADFLAKKAFQDGASLEFATVGSLPCLGHLLVVQDQRMMLVLRVKRSVHYGTVQTW
ncbi:unnamed protein product [Ilex paraguariensis]|uniref:RNase H type-1 domain-containing protein n=1 Tax=Ilex paraguariensis TaxID=185542 RepID=A0ABC8SKQ1_9AQUA